MFNFENFQPKFMRNEGKTC